MKQNNFTLLDGILRDMKKICISELKYCDNRGRKQIAQLITDYYPAESASLYEWNDAIQYFTGAAGENSEDKAREKLIHLLGSIK